MSYWESIGFQQDRARFLTVLNRIATALEEIAKKLEIEEILEFSDEEQ